MYAYKKNTTLACPNEKSFLMAPKKQAYFVSYPLSYSSLQGYIIFKDLANIV